MVSKQIVPNFMHIVLNNGVHDSVGGQPSAGYEIDFTRIAEACGYTTIGHPVTERDGLIEAISYLKDCGGASFIDVYIHKGLNRKLPPLFFSHREAIDSLMEELNND